MPKVALADLLADWDSLLRATDQYRDEKGLRSHIDKLQAAYDQLRDLKALREEMEARRQQATQEMGHVKDEGKTAAIELRSMLKGFLGHSNERLVHFNVRPLRKRGPRRKRAAGPPPTS